MEVRLNSIDGIADAITSLYVSKRTITPELQEDIRDMCEIYTDRYGISRKNIGSGMSEKFNTSLDKVCKYGKHHTTLLRFIDLSFMVYGMHRAGQDDWDAHACRYNNRIVRSSTRLATFGQDEMSDFYKGKILTLDNVLDFLEHDLPEQIVKDGVTYVRGVNGYIREDVKDDKDVKRGLYMLSIPSNFIFRVNLCEWAHVYKERNINGTANPEVKELCEKIADLLEAAHPQFTRDLFNTVKN